MKYIITSDFHLKFYENEDDKQRRSRIEKFLMSLIGNIDGLILAGDIFDLWVEWDNVIIMNYFNTLKIFSLLKESGCRLVYLSGNHDFWLGKFLKEEIGFEIYKDNFTDTINGKQLFISHGDLYTKNDFRYKFFRRLLRLNVIEKIFKLLHPDIALKIGRSLSRTSRNRKTSHKLSAKKEEGLLLKAKKLQKKYDLIIFAHTHNPLEINMLDSKYFNCGDWLYNNSYVYFDEYLTELRYYKK